MTKKTKQYLIALIVIGLIFVIALNGRKEKRRAIAGIGAPVQEEVSGSTKLVVDGYNVNIEYKYSYDIKALVVSTQNYGSSSLAGKLAPRDVVLVWGDVARYNDRIDFHWRQSNRWYYWNTKTFDEIKVVGGTSGIISQSSNNHLIPANDTVRKQIKSIRTGDYIRITGFLVDVDAKRAGGASFWWNSSTSREDTGDGSCEVIYVTKVQWLD